jgi:hypothetical protein
MAGETATTEMAIVTVGTKPKSNPALSNIRMLLKKRTEKLAKLEEEMPGARKAIFTPAPKPREAVEGQVEVSPREVTMLIYTTRTKSGPYGVTTSITASFVDAEAHAPEEIPYCLDEVRTCVVWIDPVTGKKVASLPVFKSVKDEEKSTKSETKFKTVFVTGVRHEVIVGGTEIYNMSSFKFVGTHPGTQFVTATLTATLAKPKEGDAADKAPFYFINFANCVPAAPPGFREEWTMAQQLLETTGCVAAFKTGDRETIPERMVAVSDPLGMGDPEIVAPDGRPSSIIELDPFSPLCKWTKEAVDPNMPPTLSFIMMGLMAVTDPSMSDDEKTAVVSVAIRYVDSVMSLTGIKDPARHKAMASYWLSIYTIRVILENIADEKFGLDATTAYADIADCAIACFAKFVIVGQYDTLMRGVPVDRGEADDIIGQYPTPELPADMMAPFDQSKPAPFVNLTEASAAVRKTIFEMSGSGAGQYSLRFHPNLHMQDEDTRDHFVNGKIDYAMVTAFKSPLRYTDNAKTGVVFAVLNRSCGDPHNSRYLCRADKPALVAAAHGSGMYVKGEVESSNGDAAAKRSVSEIDGDGSGDEAEAGHAEKKAKTTEEPAEEPVAEEAEAEAEAGTEVGDDDSGEDSGHVKKKAKKGSRKSRG